MAEASAREIDNNGYVTIQRNPISKAGVFPYSGKSLPGGDPDKIYNVLRPAEELSSPETLKSFKMIPLINEHVMLGAGFATSPEEKGVHGSTGEDVTYEGDTLFAPLRIFSSSLKALIDSGKRALSCGYRCMYEKSSGVFNGQAYDYVQRNIRGNHIALVQEGRCGPDIAVLDSMAFDHFDLALTMGEDTMAEEAEKSEEKKKDEAAAKDEGAGTEAESEAKKGMTLEEAAGHLEKILPMLESMNSAIAALKGAGETENAVLDEDKEKFKKEKEGMDAALDARLKAVESRTTKEVLAEVAARDALVKELTPAVGTFDHAEMTTAEVAAYGLEKLGLKAPKGQERATLDGYLAGRKSASSDLGLGMDMAASVNKDSKLANTLQSLA